MLKDKEIEWRDYLTADEAKEVAYLEQARRDATEDLKVIRNRCYARANRKKNDGR
jgi:hypothetical protein